MSILLLSCIWVFLFLSSYGLEPFETIPKGILKKWTMREITDPASLIHLKIAVVNPNDAAFEEHATKISTPFSGHYRKHLTASQLAEWVSPSPADVSKVRQWLWEYGIHAEQRHDLVVASMPFSKAQMLLNTTYHNYHSRQGRVVQRTHEYYVPEHLTQIIEFIHPTVNFPFERRPREDQSTDDSSYQSRALETFGLDERATDPCSSLATTPACLNKVYNATYTAPYSSNITLVDLATYGSLPNTTNLEIYLKRYNPLPLKRKDYISAVGEGGKNTPADPADVFDQFVELMMGHGTTLRGSATGINGLDGVYIWGPRKGSHDNPKKVKEGENGFVHYLHSLAHATHVPTVVTQSEYSPESELTSKYMRFLCKVFARVSARGTSFLQQVDDYGSGAVPHDGKVVFEAAFPSTCPWVSGVGATVWDRGDETEKAATWQTRKLQIPGPPGTTALSSGLFSQTFPRPGYQAALVPGYVKKYKLEKLYGNNSTLNTTGFVSTGRALPDFSVLACRVPVVIRGKVKLMNSPVIGAPIAAGFIGRLNAYEQSKGRPSLGHLNPFFYQNPDLFNDITCCGDNGVVAMYPNFRNYTKINHYGFPVAKGWDAVTGLGSFRFFKIQQALDRMAAVGALG